MATGRAPKRMNSAAYEVVAAVIRKIEEEELRTVVANYFAQAFLKRSTSFDAGAWDARCGGKLTGPATLAAYRGTLAPAANAAPAPGIAEVLREMQIVATGEYEGHGDNLDPWTADNRATIDGWQARIADAAAPAGSAGPDA